MKKIIAYKWFLNESTGLFTGKEYTVMFSKETVVVKILSVFAVEKHSTNRVDITLAEVEGADLDVFIDQMFDWDSLLAEQHPKRDQFFHMAKAIVYKHVKMYRD